MNAVVTGTTNPARIQADLERRRSAAASPIPSKKVRRQGSRKAARRAAINDHR